MGNLINLLKEDISLLILFIIIIILVIGMFILIGMFYKLNKRYTKFIKKLSGERNIEEDLENYLSKVDKVEKQNLEIQNYLKQLDNEIMSCIKKVGIVRYNAFKDTGSDLSFALAMLDEKNNGIVLNGIYSREMSNIYAKPVEKGKSTYTLSEEESQAIKKAIESSGNIRVE